MTDHTTEKCVKIGKIALGKISCAAKAILPKDICIYLYYQQSANCNRQMWSLFRTTKRTGRRWSAFLHAAGGFVSDPCYRLALPGRACHVC